MKAPNTRDVLIGLTLSVTFLCLTMAWWDRRVEEIWPTKLEVVTNPKPKPGEPDAWIRRKASPGAKLTARTVKPSKARVAATEEEREALDLMREGDFEAAGKILDEMARQPEPWLIEMRKKLGMTNIYAPVGPSWEEIEALKPEEKP